MKRRTPEGHIFADAMTSPDVAPLAITGHLPCKCGSPDCKATWNGVAITFNGSHTVLASTPEAVDRVIKALLLAKAFVFGNEGA